MSDWTSGYVADIGYTYGYYAELNPLRVKLAFLNAGLVAPDTVHACELGFGQGLSVNMHAAASQTNWHGTDFNPAQAGFAQQLAAKSGASAALVDQGFEQFCYREDLPEFDYIGLHGIWSWISDENRTHIVNFISKKLKVGGVLYISYNTQPGWAAMVPMRELLTQHSDVMGSDGQGIIPRIDAALGFVDKLLLTNPSYFKTNPQVAERLKSMKGQNRNYLAHEYFNRDWLPMSFAKMSEWLKPAKMDFACSAHLLDAVTPINLTIEQQALLNEIPDVYFRQTVRDFIVNQQFRRDYWVKGARQLSLLDQVEAIRNLRFLLVTEAADVSLKVTGSLGEASMSEAIYKPILAAFSNTEVRTVGQIERLLEGQNIAFAQLKEALLILTGSNHIVLVQDDQSVAASKQASANLNQCLLKSARGSSDVSYLASPVTGGAHTVSRFEQLFMLAIQTLPTDQGSAITADQLAAFVWDVLVRQGQKLVKEGVALATAEENLAELSRQAQVFLQKKYPVMQALQIC